MGSDNTGKKFMKRHWKMVSVWILAALLMVAGAVTVFLWYAHEAQANGDVPAALSGWSVGNIFDFLIHLAFWEVLLVGIPVAAICIASWALWWKKLPKEYRKEYRIAGIFDWDSKSSKAGNAFSFIFQVLFILKVYWDGNWDTPISTWSFDYVVDTGLWVIMVVLLVAAIPLTLGAIWWFSSGRKKFSMDGC